MFVHYQQHEKMLLELAKMYFKDINFVCVFKSIFAPNSRWSPENNVFQGVLGVQIIRVFHDEDTPAVLGIGGMETWVCPFGMMALF